MSSLVSDTQLLHNLGVRALLFTISMMEFLIHFVMLTIDLVRIFIISPSMNA